jgi:hypothetical protein
MIFTIRQLPGRKTKVLVEIIDQHIIGVGVTRIVSGPEKVFTACRKK